MALGAVADQLGAGPLEVDADRDAAGELGVVGIDQPLARVQLGERLGIEQRVAAAEADLRQPRALAHQDRERARADLGIERPVIARGDAVEAARLVGDHAGEHVEPAGRAFRVGGRRDVGGQRQALDQRHDVDAVRSPAPRRRRARSRAASSSSMRSRDGGARPRQEARAHPVGDARRAADRDSPAGSGRERTAAPRGWRRASASAAIMRSGRMPLSSAERLSGTMLRAQRSRRTCRSCRRSKPMPRLDGKPSCRVMSLNVIPWSFEPAGLQPRKTNC